MFRTITLAACLVAGLAACQPAADDAATTDTAVQAAPTDAALVADVTALIEADEACNQMWNAATPRFYQIIPLEGGAQAVIADCTRVNEQMWHALYVRAADGTLMRQPLIAYAGAPDMDMEYEATSVLPLSWDGAAGELSSTMTLPEEGGGEVIDTIRWRWGGTEWAMIDTARRSGSETAVSWPSDPATPDPTPELTPAV